MRKINFPTIVLLVVCVFLLQACSDQTETKSPRITSPTPYGNDLPENPLVIAEMLNDPERVEDGTWSLLRGLGLGVYDAQGNQLLAGSEVGEQDVWLYDFEVPLLADMAFSTPVPIIEYHTLLESLGYQGTLEEMLSIYQRVYTEQSTAFLPQLMMALGVQFSPEAEITPLVSWLLLLDTFVPPNPQQAVSSQSWSKLAAPVNPQNQLCGSIIGGTFSPNWGLVHSDAEVQNMLSVIETYYAIHGPLLASALQVEFSSTNHELHEGHGGKPGDIAEITARVVYNTALSDRQQDSTSWITPVCGPLVNYDRPLEGPIDGARLWWRVDGDFESHGSFQTIEGHAFDGYSPMVSKPDGKAWLIYQTQAEKADGQGDLKTVDPSLSVTVEAKATLQSQGIHDPRLLSFVPEDMTVKAPPPFIRIMWHELEAYLLKGTLAFKYDQTGPDFAHYYQIWQEVTFELPVNLSDSEFKHEHRVPTSGLRTVVFQNVARFSVIPYSSESDLSDIRNGKAFGTYREELRDIAYPCSISSETEADVNVFIIRSEKSLSIQLEQWAFPPNSVLKCTLSSYLLEGDFEWCSLYENDFIDIPLPIILGMNYHNEVEVVVQLGDGLQKCTWDLVFEPLPEDYGQGTSP